MNDKQSRRNQLRSDRRCLIWTSRYSLTQPTLPESGNKLGPFCSPASAPPKSRVGSNLQLHLHCTSIATTALVKTIPTPPSSSSDWLTSCSRAFHNSLVIYRDLFQTTPPYREHHQLQSWHHWVQQEWPPQQMSAIIERYIQRDASLLVMRYLVER